MVRAWHGHGMASVNQTRPHCVNQMGKTHSNPLAARHGHGIGTACYVCESALRALARAVTESESIVFYRITWIVTYYTACRACESQQELFECNVICISSWMQFWFLVSFQMIRSMSRFRMIYEVLWLVHFRDETWTNSRALSHSPILSVSVLASQALKMCGL